ncbi:MAG: histidinol dehydrogenase [Brevinematia bacterium]
MRITNLRGEILDSIPRKGSEVLLEKEVVKVVERIIEDVRKNGDKAVIEYLREFDEFEGDQIKVSEDEFLRAREEVETSVELTGVVKGFLEMIERVKSFHQEQLRHFHLYGKWVAKTKGIVGQVIKPIERVCVYVPGGRAIYPSTLIMNLIPAKVAGVKEIFVSTPSKKGKIPSVILYLCEIMGINDVFKVGGAVAVASFAFGTETIPKADMIVGPGNKYYVTAKKILNGIIGIDMLPGPSEIAVIANTGNPHFISLDLLSQLEHDPDSSGYFISTNQELIERVKEEVLSTLDKAKRKDILSKSVDNFFFILVESIEEGFEIVNAIAPEHLEVIVEGISIENIDNYVKNAGTVIIGNNTPVVLTDYIAGVNHVLPTGATARFSSPLGVYNFVKLYNIAQWDNKSLEEDIPTISKLARYEQLEIHALSAERRSNS